MAEAPEFVLHGTALPLEPDLLQAASAFIQTHSAPPMSAPEVHRELDRTLKSLGVADRFTIKEFEAMSSGEEALLIGCLHTAAAHGVFQYPPS